MQHLTLEEIRGLVDRTLPPEREAGFLAHASECRHCGRALALERALREAIQTAPVHRTSRQFTSNLMRRIDPATKQGFLFRLFGGVGKTVAMAAVLGVIGYALSLNLPGTPADDSGPASVVFQYLSSTYESARTFLTSQSSQVNQTVDQRASGQGMQILAMTFVVLLVLGLLDRFVLRHFVRHQIRMKT